MSGSKFALRMMTKITILLCVLTMVNSGSVERLFKTLPKVAAVHGKDILLLSKHGLQLYGVDSDVADCRLPSWFSLTVHELRTCLLRCFSHCYCFVARSKCKPSRQQMRVSTQHMYRPFKHYTLSAREARRRTVVFIRFDLSTEQVRLHNRQRKTDSKGTRYDVLPPLRLRRTKPTIRVHWDARHILVYVCGCEFGEKPCETTCEHISLRRRTHEHSDSAEVSDEIMSQPDEYVGKWCFVTITHLLIDFIPNRDSTKPTPVPHRSNWQLVPFDPPCSKGSVFLSEIIGNSDCFKRKIE